MKKRCISLVLVAMLVFSLLSTSVFALETGKNSIGSDSVAVETESVPLYLPQSVGQGNDTTSELQMLSESDFVPDLNEEPLADLTGGRYGARSAVSVTQQFTDTLDQQGSAKYVIFSLSQDQVAQITLRSPDNADLDYDLMLYKINSEGYTEGPIQTSSLGTYIG